MSRPRHLGWLVLAGATIAYLCVVAFILFEPSNRVPSSSIAFISRHLTARGLPLQISGTQFVDFWCNMLILIPPGFAVVVLWPRITWERWTILAFALSGSVELTQQLFLPHRVPAFSDVVANTGGVLIGSGVAALMTQIGRAHV